MLSDITKHRTGFAEGIAVEFGESKKQSSALRVLKSSHLTTSVRSPTTTITAWRMYALPSSFVWLVALIVADGLGYIDIAAALMRW